MKNKIVLGGIILCSLLEVAGRNAAPIGAPVEAMINVSGPAASAYGSQELHSVKVTLLEVLRGNQAWDRLKETDSSTHPPSDGFEYLLARIRMEYDPNGAEGNLAYTVDRNDFKLYSDNDGVYQLPAVQPPKPEMIGQIFYPGDSREGWIPFQVAVDDPNPLLFFFGGMWFQLS